MKQPAAAIGHESWTSRLICAPLLWRKCPATSMSDPLARAAGRWRLYNRVHLRGGPDWGLRWRHAHAALSAEPVEPDPVSTGVGSRSCACTSISTSSSRSICSLHRRCRRRCARADAPGRRSITVLEEVVVTATLREQSLLADARQHHCAERADTPAMPGSSISRTCSAHVPNLNWAGGTSRPRYFQMRGIGELEQYQGAPNPSVGFLIDDIDFSGIGMPATLFDVGRRSKCCAGRRARATARTRSRGLIVMRSAGTVDELGSATEATVRRRTARIASASSSATGPVDALSSAWRVACSTIASDGFRDDVFLDRDDTNDRDELTGARQVALAAERRQARSTSTRLHVEARQRLRRAGRSTTRAYSLADRPGKDAQTSDGGSLRVETTAGSLGQLTRHRRAVADSDSDVQLRRRLGQRRSTGRRYTYDYFTRSTAESHDAQRRGAACCRRTRAARATSRGSSASMRSSSMRADETERRRLRRSVRRPELDGTLDDCLFSHYDARNVAAVRRSSMAGSSERWGWSFGLRGERRTADYRDRGIRQASARDRSRSDDTMWAGRRRCTSTRASDCVRSRTVSRGYKAGGFNLGASRADAPRSSSRSICGASRSARSASGSIGVCTPTSRRST